MRDSPQGKWSNFELGWYKYSRYLFQSVYMSVRWCGSGDHGPWPVHIVLTMCTCLQFFDENLSTPRTVLPRIEKHFYWVTVTRWCHLYRCFCRWPLSLPTNPPNLPFPWGFIQTTLKDGQQCTRLYMLREIVSSNMTEKDLHKYRCMKIQVDMI